MQALSKAGRIYEPASGNIRAVHDKRFEAFRTLQANCVRSATSRRQIFPDAFGAGAMRLIPATNSVLDQNYPSDILKCNQILALPGLEGGAFACTIAFA